jgi:DNA-binding NarL/FixJ family response regulator
VSKLSHGEFQVLRQLAVGRSVTEIAAELAISVKTVSTYRARVLEKMHLDTNADLTTYALRNGLLQ